MKISDIYAKTVVSDAGKKGYIISVHAYKGKLVYLTCADENEKEFTVDMRDILSIGENIVYEDRATAVKKSLPIRLGCAAFNESGKYLGNLEEVTFDKNRLQKAKIGKKNYPAEAVICGDIAIVKSLKRLKSDVVKDGKVIFKKGTFVTDEVLKRAESEGEYVQTTVKSI